MIAILVASLLVLCGTHYIAYTLGEDASTAKWVKRMRELQARFDTFMTEARVGEVKKIIVKSKTKKSRKVAINKK